MGENNIIIAFDGHDGSGKTTLANLLVSDVNGIYVRPFAGNVGASLIAAANNKDFELTLLIGKEAICNIIRKYNSSILVFDRHWMTVLSLVNESYWNKWSFFPPTILCWADLVTTNERLNNRTEEKYDNCYHQTYLDIYKNIAENFNCLIINTSNRRIEQCFNDITSWIAKNNILNDCRKK